MVVGRRVAVLLVMRFQTARFLFLVSLSLPYCTVAFKYRAVTDSLPAVRSFNLPRKALASTEAISFPREAAVVTSFRLERRNAGRHSH